MAFATAIGCPTQNTTCLRNISTAAIVKVGGTPFGAASLDAGVGEAFCTRAWHPYPAVRVDPSLRYQLVQQCTGLDRHQSRQDGYCRRRRARSCPGKLTLPSYKDEPSINLRIGDATMPACSAATGVSWPYLPAGRLMVPAIARIRSDVIFNYAAQLVVRSNPDRMDRVRPQ